MVPAAGVEPATFRSGSEHSNPLSYAGLNNIVGFKEVQEKCTAHCSLVKISCSFCLDVATDTVDCN